MLYDAETGFEKPSSHVAADTPSVSSTASSALAKGKKDVRRAALIMEKAVRKDMTLYRLLMDPLVKTACYEAVRSAHKSDNGKCWHTAQPSSETERSRIVALSNGTAASLMNFSLMGRTRMGDATHEQLLEAYQFYSVQAKDMGTKAAWIKLVHDKLPEGKTVKQAFTELKLAELREVATHA